LFATSGWLWTAVGVMLCSLAAHWLLHIAGGLAIALGASGLVLAVLAYWFMFVRIAHKNIARIEQRPDVTCFFAFQPWRSYGLMVFMMVLGITLRHSGVPKYYLAVIYTAIGGALFLASLSYHARFWRERRNFFKNLPV
jgi:hypothetical protein